MIPKNLDDHNNIFVTWFVTGKQHQYSYESPESFWEIIEKLDCKYAIRYCEHNDIEVTIFLTQMRTTLWSL
jgi:hypothetical protein